MDNLEKMIVAAKQAYGDNWQSPLSRALGISDRTVRNFVSGKSRVSENMSERLLSAMTVEIDKIKSAIEIIESDKMCGDDVSIELIAEIVDQYEYHDVQDYKNAIDAVNNAVNEITYLSDLHSVAQKFAV